MAQFLSGNVQSNLNLGITSSTENQTVLQVTGKVGIGTTDAQQYALYVAGDTNISGVSSISGVLISSGIVTSSKTSGIVTYYGDGSKLIGISGFAVTTQSPVSTPVYLTLASAAGVSTAGISTTKLTFIPSSGSLGVNTSSPRNSLDVIGSIGIQSSGSSNRFHIQHNPTLNSLDFIFE